MIDKKAKFRLRVSDKSPEEQVEKLSALPACPAQISMVGVGLQGKKNNSKTMKVSSPCSFLPAEVGRKNLVQSPLTAARNEYLKKVRQDREAAERSSPDSDKGRLPDIDIKSSKFSRPNSGSPQGNFKMNFDPVTMCGPRGKQTENIDGPERITLPAIQASPLIEQKRKSAASNRYNGMNWESIDIKCPNSAEGRSRKLPEIRRAPSSRISENDSCENLPVLPELTGVKQSSVNSNIFFKPAGNFGKNSEKQLPDLKRMEKNGMRQVFLPTLSQNCELVTGGKIQESNCQKNRSANSQSRRNKRIRSGKDHETERKRGAVVISPTDLMRFEDELVGTACQKTKRDKKQRQKSGLPGLKNLSSN